jgi:ATP-dependent DNA ligase
VKKQYEGLVLKRNNGKYGDVWGRIKHRTSIDYVCMGIDEGRGRLEGMVGGILGGLFNDDKECVVVCKVGGGMKDDERKNLWENREQLIGSVFTAGGYKVYKSGAIRHPQFMGFRDDKQAGECTFDQIPS